MKPRSQRISWMLVFAIRRSLIPFMKTPQGMLYPDFSYYNPTAILNHKVPFIKVKTIANNEGIMPYIFDELERVSDYPLDLILNHMSMIDRPDYPYLLSRKYLKNQELAGDFDKSCGSSSCLLCGPLGRISRCFQAFHFRL